MLSIIFCEKRRSISPCGLNLVFSFSFPSSSLSFHSLTCQKMDLTARSPPHPKTSPPTQTSNSPNLPAPSSTSASPPSTSDAAATSAACPVPSVFLSVVPLPLLPLPLQLDAPCCSNGSQWWLPSRGLNERCCLDRKPLLRVMLIWNDGPSPFARRHHINIT